MTPPPRTPLRDVLSTRRDLWDRDDVRPSVREAFAKVIACGTPALGAEVFASAQEERTVYHTCISCMSGPTARRMRLVATRRRPVTADGQLGPDGGRLVDRPTATLRPHPTYQALCSPIAATRVRRVAQQPGPIREPLLTTSEGTILDGHARWQVALDRQQPSLPCIEYDVTKDEALQIVIQHHRASEGLNDFCRIVMALDLEPSYRERSRRPRPAVGARKLPSNLTNAEHRDVRKAIARVAGVSTGNVTKVKQLLSTVIQETRARLLWGEVSIHRAWQWRTLTAKAQRDALWEHLHRGAIKTTIARLVRAHVDARAPVRPADVAATVLGGLARLDADDITVAVVDVPGRAVVVTRACYDELREKHTR